MTQPVGMKIVYIGGMKAAIYFSVWPLTLAVVAGVLLLMSPAWADDSFARLADPTRPSSVSSIPEAVEYSSGPVLQSTLISSGSRRAVIGGRSYNVGEKVGNAVITDIQPYEVVLKQANRETRLRLLPKLAKQPRVLKTRLNSQEGRNYQ